MQPFVCAFVWLIVQREKYGLPIDRTGATVLIKRYKRKTPLRHFLPDCRAAHPAYGFHLDRHGRAPYTQDTRVDIQFIPHGHWTMKDQPIHRNGSALAPGTIFRRRVGRQIHMRCDPAPEHVSCGIGITPHSHHTHGQISVVNPITLFRIFH
jgi:hypothetical protein